MKQATNFLQPSSNQKMTQTVNQQRCPASFTCMVTKVTKWKAYNSLIKSCQWVSTSASSISPAAVTRKVNGWPWVTKRRMTSRPSLTTFSNIRGYPPLVFGVGAWVQIRVCCICKRTRVPSTVPLWTVAWPHFSRLSMVWVPKFLWVFLQNLCRWCSRWLTKLSSAKSISIFKMWSLKRLLKNVKHQLSSAMVPRTNKLSTSTPKKITKLMEDRTRWSRVSTANLLQIDLMISLKIFWNSFWKIWPHLTQWIENQKI